MENHKPVFVYVVASGDCVKIGISSSPERRLKGLSTALATPAFIAGRRAFPNRQDARRMERRLHWLFRKCRARGEWFRVPARDAVDALRRTPRPDSPGDMDVAEMLFERRLA